MKMFHRVLIAAALAAASFSTAEARLAPVEQRMVAVIDAEQERTLALLEKMVNQNSGSLNLAGVEAVGKMVRAELEPLGFQVEWIPMTETGRAGHLLAAHEGRKDAKRLLLIGHLDTVFELDSPFQKWTRRGNDGEGPGAADDKGGIAVMVAALRAMKAAGTLGNANIEIMLTGDEEDTGLPIETARRDLIAAGKRADAALDFEGLSIDGGKDMGVVARRGSMSWTVKVSATPSHSSGVFSAESGYGAIYELARIVDAFRRELPEDKLTYNVGLIGGGQTAKPDDGRIRVEATGKTNIIAAAAYARGDMRALTPQQVERTQAKMRAIVAKPLPGATSTIEYDADAFPPMAPTPGNRALLAALNRVNAGMGLEPQAELDPLKRGAGDISFVALDVDGLVGLGPASRGDHAPGETVDIASIWRQAKRAAILMSRLADERK